VGHYLLSNPRSKFQYLGATHLEIQSASRETDVFEINIIPLIFSVEFIYYHEMICYYMPFRLFMYEKLCHLNDDHFGECTFVVAPGSLLLLSPTALG